MTMAEAMARFAVLTSVLAVTPGLDTILVLRQALRGGRRAGFAAALGVCLGVVVWGVTAAAGLAALLVASQTAFQLLRYAGVAFLLWLGWSYLRSAFRGTGAAEFTIGTPDPPGEALVKGLLTNVLNPKMAVFYLTVLPLFLPVGHPPIVAGALLAGVHALMGAAWFTIVIVGAHGVRRLLATRRGAQAVDGVAGTAMLGFGVAVALER